jgi:hypothetical protein
MCVLCDRILQLDFRLITVKASPTFPRHVLGPAEQEFRSLRAESQRFLGGRIPRSCDLIFVRLHKQEPVRPEATFYVRRICEHSKDIFHILSRCTIKTIFWRRVCWLHDRSLRNLPYEIKMMSLRVRVRVQSSTSTISPVFHHVGMLRRGVPGRTR